MTSDNQDPIAKAKEDLLRLRDEVRVKMHLAKKDAEDAWTSLQPTLDRAEKKLDELSAKAGDGAEKARLEASLALSELKTQWPQVEKAIESAAADAKSEILNLKKKLFG